MKKTAILAMTAALACGVSQAQARNTATVNTTVASYTPTPAGTVDGVMVENLSITRNGRYISVDMLIDMKNLKVSGNRAVLLTPRIVNGNDSISLPAVGVYGRRRYYTYIRNGESMLSGADEKTFKASKKPDTLPYRADVDYEEWMDGARLTLEREEYGCCNSILDDQYAMLGGYDAPVENAAFFPELVYVQPKAEMSKSRTLEGSAFIDFPVDRTEIHPEYRRNAVELGKIQASIDSVRDDSDVTITQVWLKGFASPESPYAHNRDLAIGRTAALKKYIQQLYRFDNGIIATGYEPEDWAGLRRFVERSNISHKSEIMALIDSDRNPDAKEAEIKRAYPAEYRFMLQNFYPALRHTDYRIAYNIRSYSDVEEIKRIFATRPQKLSLNEFYIMAQEYEPGSDEFTEVYETAVRMFPDDATANLNAANAAMRRGDNAAAERYLSKAGDSPEAVYARGALAIRSKDYDTALRYMNEAQNRGISQAAVVLDELTKIKR